MRIEELDSSSYLEIKKMEDSLKMLLDSDSSEKIDISNFDIKEFNKYKKRLQEKGDYTNTKQGQFYKLRTLKKIFNLDNKADSKSDVMLLNKDKLNRDYSVRHSLILKALAKEGTEEEPVTIEYKGLKISKVGSALDKTDISLFDYLIGQFIENGECRTKLISNEELAHGLNIKNTRGYKFEPIKQALERLANQKIKIDDLEAKDKATKQIRKKLSENGIKNIKDKGANLLQVSFIEVEGQLATKFEIPFMKMYCSHRQYTRLISGQATKHIFKNPRIYLICKELASLFRNKNNDTLSAETLLKNIGEWEVYNQYKTKKMYLLRLKKDIETASSYILTTKKFIIENFTESKLKQGRIRVKEV